MRPRPTLPGYRLLSRLGGGPCCDVFAAEPDDGGDCVAIKTLRVDRADDLAALSSLRREARAGLSVSHRHLVEYFDTHLVEPPYYIVMELLPGQSAKRRVLRGRLPVPTALAVARQVAEALAVLHAADFIHGDVKADNIRLVSTSRAVLVDLGFAHRPGEHPGATGAALMMGTPNYMAPELCEPPVTDTPAADIFALGVTLHLLLTGFLPYPEGATKDVVRRRRTDDAADLNRIRGEWVSGLPELVRSMTDPDPTARPRAKQLVHKLIALQILTMRKRAG